MALTVLSDHARAVPGIAAVPVAKGQLLAYGYGANAAKFVPFTADHTLTPTSDPVGFADTDVVAGECVSAVYDAIMGDDGSGTPITGAPGHTLYGGMTPGAIQATAPNVASDLVSVVGQWVAYPGQTAATTDKFRIRLWPAMLVSGQPS